MNTTRLGDITGIITSGSRGWASYYSDDGALFLRMTNLPKNGIKLLLDDNKFVKLSEETSEAKRTIVQDGDILISITAELGKIGFVENIPQDEAYVNQHVCLARPLPQKVNPKFLAYYLSSQTQRNLLNRLNDAGAKSGLNLQTISKFPIRIPDRRMQDFIVEVLEQWDAAIEKTEALIDAKGRRFRWLITKLINRQREHLTKLGEHFGKSIIIEKGEQLIKTDISDNGNIPVIAGGKTSPYTHNRYTHSMPCITVSASGAYAGYVWYHDYPIWASDCNVIYSTENSTRYIYFALKFNQPRIYALQSGGGQPHIYARDLRRIAIPLPNITEQKRISEILNTAQHEIDQLKSLAKQYGMQKRGLMQKLLTGKWRIDNG